MRNMSDSMHHSSPCLQDTGYILWRSVLLPCTGSKCLRQCFWTQVLGFDPCSEASSGHDIRCRKTEVVFETHCGSRSDCHLDGEVWRLSRHGVLCSRILILLCSRLQRRRWLWLLPERWRLLFRFSRSRELVSESGLSWLRSESGIADTECFQYPRPCGYRRVLGTPAPCRMV